jgi:hypothetical protein
LLNVLFHYVIKSFVDRIIKKEIDMSILEMNLKNAPTVF